MNTAKNLFLCIDHEILSYVTSWLEIQDIVSLSLTQRKLKFLLREKSVWNLQLKNYLPPIKLLSDDFPKSHPKEFFVFILTKFQKIRALLSDIIKKVNPNMNSKKWLDNNYKRNIGHRREIENIIAEDYQSIPVDYYILFRLLNGQDQLLHYFPHDVCFFGGYSFHEKYYEFEYLPFTQPEFPFLQKLNFHTLAINREKGIRYYVDFQNVLKNGEGSIFSFLSQRHENQTLVFRVFIFKKSIIQLLEDLQHSPYLTKKNLIDHFDTLCCPQSDVTTDGIRIRVSSIFNPWEMSSNGFSFAYQIRVSANGLKGKWRLTCRHLIITDGNNQEEVEGVELNGKAYEIYQNGEDLFYESWIYTQSLTTSMKGYLYFVNTSTNQEIRAQIGETMIQFPKGCSLIDFNQNDLSIKVLIDRRENPDKSG